MRKTRKHSLKVVPTTLARMITDSKFLWRGTCPLVLHGAGAYGLWCITMQVLPCRGNIINSINHSSRTILYQSLFRINCLQCFDAVGWAAGRDPACKKLSDGMLAWLSGSRCRFAYGSADTIATHYLLLQ